MGSPFNAKSVTTPIGTPNKLEMRTTKETHAIGSIRCGLRVDGFSDVMKDLSLVSSGIMREN